jgi:hypothetical protein
MPFDDGDEWYHAVPIKDAMEHHASCKCPCNPVRNDRLWIHNCFDGRDFMEDEYDGIEERNYWRPH